MKVYIVYNISFYDVADTHIMGVYANYEDALECKNKTGLYSGIEEWDIEGHLKVNAIIYPPDKNNPVYGIYTTLEKAEEALDIMYNGRESCKEGHFIEEYTVDV